MESLVVSRQSSVIRKEVMPGTGARRTKWLRGSSSKLEAQDTEVAKLNAATDAEIEDAVHAARSSAGWSTYLHGMQIDRDQFAAELAQVADYVRGRALATAAD
jgi:hypothetical protein